MTEEQIMKALEYHRTTMENHCNECPYKGRLCSIALSSDALDLINRQKAEIEKLNVELVGMRGACESYKMHYDNAQAEIERLNIRNKALTAITKNYDWKFKKAKSEAIKEFANLIKRRLNSNTSRGAYLIDIVDNLVKEMTEESENG